MDNNKRCTLKVEVPRKRPELKDVLIEAGIQGLKEAASALANSLTSNEDNGGTVEWTIDIPKIKVTTSASDDHVDTPDEEVSQETLDEEEAE